MIGKWLLALLLTVLAMCIISSSMLLGTYLLGPGGAIIFVVMSGSLSMNLSKFIKE